MSKTRILNKSKQLPLATDDECYMRRKILIHYGIIKEGDDKLVDKGDNVAVSTKTYASTLRESLIASGLIDPDYIKLLPRDRSIKVREEGQFKPDKPISSDRYERVRRAYLRSLQEILVARRELNLNLGPKKDSDPDWIF